MARARNWREVRNEALENGRITEESVTEAGQIHDELIHGYQLKQLRERRMARQADVAGVMNVSQSRVSRIERGDISRTEVGTLSTYVQALGGALVVLADFGDQVLNLSVPAAASRRRIGIRSAGQLARGLPDAARALPAGE